MRYKNTTVGTYESGGEVRETRILTHIIRVTGEEWEYEADQRHADLIIKETGAEKKSCPPHPGGDKQVVAAEAETEAFVGAEATRFRVVAARANYLSGDRPDIQYAVKEICRRMAKPVRGDWEKLIRLGTYLKGAPMCVQCYEWQRGNAALTGCSDSDWAGCRTTGKSTSGGLVQLGTHLLKTWSRTQDSVTLSSAEAELLTLSKLAAEILRVRSMAIEWEVIKEGCTCQLYADAAAAVSIAKRQGAGKMRHINVRTLWLQEKAVQKVLE